MAKTKDFTTVSDYACRCTEAANAELSRVSELKRQAATMTNKYAAANDGGGNGSLPDFMSSFRAAASNDGGGNGSLPD